MPRALSLVLLVLALGAAGALAAYGAQRQEGADASFHVLALGPEGPLLDEAVEVEDATVLRALEAAAARAGLALRLEEYPGMGTYVRSIGQWTAQGATGWVYEVERDGAWRSGDRSAEFYALEKGDAMRWTWTSG